MHKFDDIRGDGTVEGRVVETHFLPAKSIVLHRDRLGGGVYLRIIMEDNGADAETRVDLTSVVGLIMKSDPSNLADAEGRCGFCAGAYLNPDMNYCPKCGHKLRR